MTLFDPYSHGRILELRQEQLARRAKRREQLRLDEAPTGIPAAAVRALLARVTHHGKASASNTRPSGRPALDS
jgi:hypothetical protein